MLIVALLSEYRLFARKADKAAGSGTLETKSVREEFTIDTSEAQFSLVKGLLHSSARCL